MADKKIKVQVNVETDVEPSIAALKALKKQLKDTAAGSEEFVRLQQKIDDIQDSLVAARKGAGNFTDVLSGLPGPLGAISGQASNLITTFKQFGQLKVVDLKASFVELGRDLVDVAQGIGNLTGLTKVYTVLNVALAKSFVAVGVGSQAAAVGARALSAALIATGIGALIVLLGTAASALYELATGTKEAEAATNSLNRALERQNELLTLNASDAQRRNKLEIAQLRANGASAQQIRETQFKQAKETYERAYKDEQDAVKLYNDNLGKADAEGLKKLADNLTKKQQATKDAYVTAQEVGLNNKAEELKIEQDKNKQLAGKSKAGSDARIAERKRELEELKKGLEEARLALLDGKSKELEEVRIKYDALKAQAIKYGEDTKVIEQARQKANTEITDKYAKEDKEKADKALSDKLSSETLALELRLSKGEINETEYQNTLYEIRKKYATSNDELIKAEIDAEEYKAEQRKINAEEQRDILLNGLQSELEVLDRANKQSDLDFEQDKIRFAEQRAVLAEMEQTELQNSELTEFQKTEIRKKYADQRTAIADSEIATERAAMQARHDINMAYLQLFEQFGSLLSQVAGKNKALAIAGIVIQQAASIGQIIANTGIANAKAVAANPLGFGQPWVTINTISAGLSIASTIASAVKSIQQINQAASQAGVTGGGGGGSVGSAPQLAPPRVGGATAPQIQTGEGINPTQQIGQTINAASAPVRAYVVSGDISTQQALDRRTNRAATFAGG
jgi:hypothetical protein